MNSSQEHLDDQLPDLLGFTGPTNFGFPLTNRLGFPTCPPREGPGRDDRDQLFDLPSQQLAALEQLLTLGRRHVYSPGQLAPQDAVLGLQVVDHLGQFGVGGPGDQQDEGVENAGHRGIRLSA